MDATFYSIAPVIATGSLKPDSRRGRPEFKSLSRKRKPSDSSMSAEKRARPWKLPIEGPAAGERAGKHKGKTKNFRRKEKLNTDTV